MPRRLAAPLLAILLLVVALPIVRAAGAPPSYGLAFLGTGGPTAINATGTVVGARLIGATSFYEPLVSTAGAPWTVLPVPAGAESVFPTDVNDSGVIVGVAYTAWNPVAVRWAPSGAGYAVEVLPRLAGDPSSYATAINNLGQVVGARRALGYVPAATTGWLYADGAGVTDLAAQYGLWTVPVDLNDAGQVISSTERLTLSTGALEDIGAAPAGYTRVANVAINAGGQVAGYAPLSSQSLNIVSAFRYTAGSGWLYLAGTSRYTTVSSINAGGDVGYGELGPGVYLDGLGTYAVGALLAPSVVAAGWAVTGSGVEINDARQIATVGRNAATGQTGAVLLTPAGTVQPPAAPTLTGIAHPATPDAPWNAISLSWTTSAGASAYIVERRAASETGFTALTPNGGTIQRIYDDTAVTPGIAYTYRVFAIGVAGTSAPSNLVTVTAPAAPVADTTAPVVTVTSPAYNARVSGTVRVAATATDNVGVVGMELRNSAGTLLSSVTGSSLTYDWNTRGLRRGSTQTLVVTAFDAAGNAGTAKVVVRIR